MANKVIIEGTRQRAPEPRLAEERKKYYRSLQAFLSYAAHRSRVSFRVPRARDYSRYPQMETSKVLAGYEELVGGLKVIKLKIIYPIFTLRSKLFQYSSGPRFAATFPGGLNK